MSVLLGQIIVTIPWPSVQTQLAHLHVPVVLDIPATVSRVQVFAF